VKETFDTVYVGLFDISVNTGHLSPSEGFRHDKEYELDENDNIMPRDTEEGGAD
jgi:hypothetical protein